MDRPGSGHRPVGSAKGAESIRFGPGCADASGIPDQKSSSREIFKYFHARICV
jgi:hypothetical protein